MRYRVMPAVAALFSLLLSSCGKGLPDASEVAAPRIEGVSFTGVTQSGATLFASVSGESQVGECGFTLTREGSLTGIEYSAALDGRMFSQTIDGLEDGCEYSFVAFVGDACGTRSVSPRVSFKTLPDATPPGPDNPGDPGNPDNPANPGGPGGTGGSGTPSDTTAFRIVDDALLGWLLWNYDTDKDGSLSAEEAARIHTIEMNSDNLTTLEGIGLFPNLTKIHAEGSRGDGVGLGGLTSIDLRGNPSLLTLYVPWNRIRDIDISANPLLGYIDVDYNEVESLDLHHLKHLNLLQVSHNRLKSLDVRGLDSLEEFHCDENPLTEIKLENGSLRYLDIHSTLIKTLDLSSCPKINEVHCHSCPHLKTITLAKGQVVGTITKDPGTTIIHNE